MFPKGTIYKSGKSEKSGELKLALSRGARIFYNLLRGIGAGLVAFAVIALLFTFGPVIKQEVAYKLGSTKEEEKTTLDTRSFVDISQADRVVEVQKEAKSYGVNSHFSVVVPKIEATSNVIPNVDANDKEEYLEALQLGVAHAKGTYFPGQGEDIFLFAHSTDSPINIARYNAVFYLLRKLEPGDNIIVFFADKKYTYEVVDKFIAEPDDVSWLENNGEGEKLFLMTCDPPGTTWRRQLIVAEPIGNEAP